MIPETVTRAPVRIEEPGSCARARAPSAGGESGGASADSPFVFGVRPSARPPLPGGPGNVAMFKGDGTDGACMPVMEHPVRFWGYIT